MQQGKNAAAFKAIKHVSKNIEIKEDASHDALILVEMQTLSTPGGPVLAMDSLIVGCPCRLREILLNLMKADKTFAAVVYSAAETHKAERAVSFPDIIDTFHQSIDPSKN